MRYHLDQPITDFAQAVVEDEKKVPLTLRMILVRSLANFDPKQNTSGDTKFKAYRLGQTIHDAPASIDLAIQDVAFIKDRVGLMWGPLVVGRVWEMLENPLIAGNTVKETLE